MKNKNGDIIKECPVCHKTLLAVGIKNHIIGRAKGELWRREKQKRHYKYYQIHKRRSSLMHLHV